MSKIIKAISCSRQPKVLRRTSNVFAVLALILELVYLFEISTNIWVFFVAMICFGFFITLYILSLLVSLAIAGDLLDESYSALKEGKLFLETLKIMLNSATDSSDETDISDASAPALLQWLVSELKISTSRTELMEKAIKILKNHYNHTTHD